jgi:hypothetical protein
MRLLGPAPSVAADEATKGYVDTADATTLTSAKTYTDGKTPAASTTVSGLSRLATTAEGQAGTLTTVSATPASVKAYADAQDDIDLAAAKSYADTQDAATLASAKTYADGYALPSRLGTLGVDISGGDWNTAIQNGFYRGNAATNAPTSDGWYYGLVQAHDTGSWHMQTVTGYTGSGTNRTFIRQRQNGTWQAWVEQTTKAYVDSRTQAATTTVSGISRLATTAEGQAGTLSTVSATPASVKQYADIADLQTLNSARSYADAGDQNSQVYTDGKTQPATTSVVGITRFATAGEASAGTSTTVASTPSAVKAYADAADATTLASAKTYTDSKAAPVTSVFGRTGAVTGAKADVGLGSVDNTADTAKPVSTAQKTYIDNGDTSTLASAKTYADQYALPTRLGQYGIDVSGTNINGLVQSGFYKGTNLTGGPTTSTSDGYIIFVNAADANTATATAAGYSGAGYNRTFTRNKVSNGWLGWNETTLASATTSTAGVTRLATTAEGTLGSSEGVAATPAAVKAYVDGRSATTTVAGVSRFATTAEASAGSSTTISASPANVKTYADAVAATTLSSAKSYTDSATPAASLTVSGLVELATQAETTAGADATRAVTPNGFLFGLVNTLRGTTAQRDSLLGTTPTVGTKWWNTDQAWEEVYLGAYTANTSGVDAARPAGWYPIAGAMPGIEADNNGVVQAVPSGGSAQVFRASRITNFGGFVVATTSSATGSGQQFTVPYAGRYQGSAGGSWAGQANGNREVTGRVNGTSWGFSTTVPGTSTSAVTVAASFTGTVPAGGVLDFRAYQNSGSSINFTMAHLSLVYLGPSGL